MYVKENGEIINLDYRGLTGVSDRTALRDLTELVQQQILNREGTTGKGTSYTLSYDTPSLPLHFLLQKLLHILMSMGPQTS